MPGKYYGNWHPKYPAPPGAGGVLQIALVNTRANNSICAQGTYQPPEGRTCDTIRAHVYNDASVTPPANPPPAGSGTVDVTYDSTTTNYDFSGAKAIPGVACGPSGSESVVIIALWAHLTATGGAAGYEPPYYYKFNGQCATKTDCG
jgi:hypothetical protein